MCVEVRQANLQKDIFEVVYNNKLHRYQFCCISASDVYNRCVNAIDCTGKSMSDSLLYALGEADANMYLCSKSIRPSEILSFSFRWVIYIIEVFIHCYLHVVNVCQLSCKFWICRLYIITDIPLQ